MCYNCINKDALEASLKKEKKTMKKRIISALLLSSMLLSITACGKDNTPDTKDTSDTTASLTEELPAGIAKQDYKSDVNIIMPEWGLYKNYFDPGDDMTDIMNKALYNREMKVEEHLGVNITYERVPTINDVLPAIATAISTNDDLYQIALNHCLNNNASMIMDGQVIDMNEMDIDFTAEWFNQKSNNALEVAGKQFFCISDYMLPDPNVVLFNKKLVEDNHLENPYQLVRDGKWTIDKMAEMASVITTDNGDTVWDAQDTYGFSAPDTWHNISFMFAADVEFIERNDDGEFELVFDNDRTYTIMEKLDNLLNSKDTFVFPNAAISGDAVARENAVLIDSGRCLFTLIALNQLYTIRNIEVDFGILPYPKLDEIQEDYISNDWSGLMFVPMSLSEDSYEMVGDVIELLAYYSAEDVIPTYIDTTLGTKLARDTDSKEMINLVFDTVQFYSGMNYFGSLSDATKRLFYTVPFMLINGGQNNFASYFATYKGSAEMTIAEFNDAVADLD